MMNVGDVEKAHGILHNHSARMNNNLKFYSVSEAFSFWLVAVVI